MKDLLQNDYISHFGLTGKYIVPCTSMQGNFALSDDKACQMCIEDDRQHCSNDGEQEIMKINANESINAIDIEQFLTLFDGRRAGIKNRCDKLLYNGIKIAFVEMYCGLSRNLYPPYYQKVGKIAKARLQIESTIQKLCEVPSIAQRIDGTSQKHGILAYRERHSPQGQESVPQPDKVQQNMEVFWNSDFQGNNLHTNLSHGFKFFVLKYPNEYKW